MSICLDSIAHATGWERTVSMATRKRLDDQQETHSNPHIRTNWYLDYSYVHSTSPLLSSRHHVIDKGSLALRLKVRRQHIRITRQNERLDLGQAVERILREAQMIVHDLLRRQTEPLSDRDFVVDESLEDLWNHLNQRFNPQQSTIHGEKQNTETHQDAPNPPSQYSQDNGTYPTSPA